MTTIASAFLIAFVLGAIFTRITMVVATKLGIVDHPDDVAVRARTGRRGPSLEVRVHPEDMGRVIGRSGRTATALRTVVSAISRDGHVRIDFLDVDER